MSKDWYESHGEPGREEIVPMPRGLKIKPAAHLVVGNVWVVCTLLEGEKAGQFEVQGVYTTKEAALAACTDPLTSAARFELNRDYRGHFEFDVVTPANPEPTPTPSPSARKQSNASCVLRVAGKAYPRTCKVCGLGPCTIGAPSDYEPA